MAYGKNKSRKDWLMRALPLGIGRLTDAKHNDLKSLFKNVLDLMRSMTQECFITEPLLNNDKEQSLEAKLIVLQKSSEGLNAVWAEQARMRVMPALEEANKRYFKKLAGSLRFVDSRIPVSIDKTTHAEITRLAQFVGPPAPRKVFYHVSLSIQSDVTEKELNDLKRIGEGKEAIALFRRVILDNDMTGLTSQQVRIVRDIHARALEKHQPPVFGNRDSFMLQLHLDYRMLPNVKSKDGPDRPAEALQLRAGETYLLADDKNVLYRRFLAISGVAPRAPRICLPVILTRKIAKRLEGTNADWSSLIIELCQDDSGAFKVGVRLVAGKPKPEPVVDLKAVTAILGRDFGYANTIALTVAISEQPIDLSAEDTTAIRLDSKEAGKAFFESHTLPDGIEIVKRIKYEGRNFLTRIAHHCDRIDAYRSRIDLAYNELYPIKAAIFSELNLSAEDRITFGLKQSIASDLVRQFYQQIGLINDLKKARRVLYRKIASIKKTWFGFLSNVEVALAREYNAVVVREDLTVEAIEKDAPNYKGRTFNKMLNNGSKGQYQKRATDKLAWNGIPEKAVGSWYTSRACHVHARVIEKKHRKGEEIYLPCCDKTDHADLHASETLACYKFLRPVSPGAAYIAPGS